MSAKTKTKFNLEIQQNAENGDLFVEFPKETLVEIGWKPGDTVQCIDNKNGSWSLKKQETQLILVECISQFLQRYVVEVPTGKPELALNAVKKNEAEEFSQEHLGETIVSQRVITRDDALNLCNKNNAYCNAWTDEKKLDVFVTKLKDVPNFESDDRGLQKFGNYSFTDNPYAILSNSKEEQKDYTELLTGGPLPTK